jgi:uncharacterized protein YraI
MRSKLMVAGLAGLIGLAATAASAVPALTTNPLNLRSGPGTGYPVITTIPAGSAVEVGTCQGSWCPVAWQSYEGYASGRYLQAGAGAVAPAPAPYPAAGVAPGVAAPYYGDGYYGDDYYDGGYYGAPIYRGGRWWYNGRWYNTRPVWRRHGNRDNDWRGGNPRNNRDARDNNNRGHVGNRAATRQSFSGGGNRANLSGGGPTRQSFSGGGNRGGGFNRGGGGGGGFSRGGGGGGGGAVFRPARR